MRKMKRISIKIKSEKNYIVLASLIIFVLVICFLGYIFYCSYIKEYGVNLNNYYSAKYLLANNYIKSVKEATSEELACSNELNNDYRNFLLKKDKGFYYQHCTSNGLVRLKITMPKVQIKKGYYSLLCDSTCQKYVYLFDDNSNLYYSLLASDTDIDNYDIYGKCVSNDCGEGYDGITYINNRIDNVKNVYEIANKEIWLYANHENFDRNTILEMNDGSLKVLKHDEGNIRLVDLKSAVPYIVPYFDYICATDSSICKETLFYITYNNTLVPSYNLEYNVKDQKNRDIIVKDAFSIFTHNLDKDNEDISYENFEFANNKFNYTIYVLDTNNDLYKVTLNKESFNKKENVIATLYKENVKDIKYITVGNDINVKVMFKHDDIEVFKNVHVSTKTKKQDFYRK